MFHRTSVLSDVLFHIRDVYPDDFWRLVLSVNFKYM